MKIVHVITRLIVGGAQENTLLSCREQIARGHRVHLLTGPPLGPEGSLMPQAEAIDGLAIEVIPSMLRRIDPLRDWQARGALRQRLAAIDPDVVHTHSSKAGILGRAAARRGCPGAAVVHTIHGLPFPPRQNAFARGLYIALERRAARQTDHFITVCDAMIDEAVELGIAPRDCYTTVYSGMDVERFVHATESAGAIRRELDIPAGATVMVKVARLFHHKGHDDVLRAMAEIVEHHPTLYLLLVGEGILRGRLLHLAQRLGIAGRLRLAGLVAPERVPAYLHAADLLVHASMREGLARALPQALLCGRPVVSYDVGGAREVCHTGETGILVAPGDWRGLARAMDQLVSDRVSRRRMGERGKGLCIERFDYRRMVDGIQAVYDAALAARRTPAGESAA